MADSSETAYHPKGDFFNLKGNHTDVKTEVGAGITTFFAMAYIIIVNPNMLSQTGMKWGAVFLATIIASVIGTLVMGLFANVPYAQAPGMGLNAFFVFTVCFGLHYKWQEALAMVFICGLLNIAITVTKVRKLIIKSIPESLQNAIGGGIGIFIAYIGVKNAGLINFTSDPGTYTLLPSKTVIASSAAVPSIVKLNSPVVLLALFGLALTIILLVRNVKGAIIISIAATTLLGIPFGITTVANTMSFSQACSELPETFLAAFGNPGMGSLFTDPAKIPLVLMTIFAFSLSDTFDTIGTFIGTGRKAGIFSAEDQKALETGDGFKSKMDKALFADATATSIGAIFGTSNTTTYVESAAGIGYGGRTGLTSVVVAALFVISAFFTPIVSVVPSAATAPVLIVVGIMMLSSFKEIEWDKLEEAIPAFFASIFMAFCYSISYGIAAGFTVYCIVKTFRGKAKEIHPILWVATGLFILNFVILAIIS
ncbi:NCS2 family permease [Caproiciproducens galactitolivorans]|uniref:NCS2 family permease n=1 Tax=Caproiciproducens galactitolivorans TaxID=642589 RepID=A0ABT4BR43_9FIRM|nr:NCS2 family permease [Caproiciproducens galactitolivorans]MCY1713357.1 NCS2 family permease [Caproiciproducens galactitolivorans]